MRLKRLKQDLYPMSVRRVDDYHFEILTFDGVDNIGMHITAELINAVDEPTRYLDLIKTLKEKIHYLLIKKLETRSLELVTKDKVLVSTITTGPILRLHPKEYRKLLISNTAMELWIALEDELRK